MNNINKSVNVELGARSYPIYIGQALVSDPEVFDSHIPGSEVIAVTNETIAPLYLQQLQTALQRYQVEPLILPDGEAFKTVEIWQRIIDRMLERRYSRQCTVVALGGGVIGDLAGFAAACYQRGVHYIQVPTTLLSQVDSSVGGKTGVNHPLGKNMIGAFYQPRCVIADTDTLKTLDIRQLSAGIAEVIKYGLINDEKLFSWLEQNIEALLRQETSALIHVIERSCRNKAAIVAADERESGQRALLNLGHTFGHAIETGVGYGEWLHGEAVAAGICMAADLSHRLGWLRQEDQTRITDLIERTGLPSQPPRALASERFLELMAVDKKVIDGKLRLVLLKGIGQALVTTEFDRTELQNMLQDYGRRHLCR